MYNEASDFSLFSNSKSHLSPLEIPSEIYQLPYGYSSGILYFQFERKNMTSSSEKKSKIFDLIPVLILFLIITIETKSYLFWHILPMLENSHNLTISFWEKNNFEYWKYALEFLAFVALAVNLMVSTILTIYTAPGEVNYELQLEAENLRDNVFQVMISEQFLEKIKKFGNCERKRTMFPRFCRSCLMVKPDRSHHCSVCNKCVLKMDHHCPYVNNCIGMKNYKYFMNMVISGTASSLLITFTMWEGLGLSWENSEVDLTFQVIIGLAYFGNLVLSVVLSAFLIFHFYLISNALTTIEFREKMTVKFDKSPYSEGCFQNFLKVFGKNPLFWLIPVSKI